MVAKIDATAEEGLAQAHQVEGYPTLKFFTEGKPRDYDGGREAADIVQWVKKRTGPPAVTVDTTGAVDKMMEEADESKSMVVLGCFQKLEGDAHAAFEAAARDVDGPLYAQTTDAKVAKHFGAKLGETVVLRTFAGGRTTYQGDASDADALTSFLKLERLNWIEVFGEDTAEKIFDSGIDKQVILFASSDDLEAGEAAYDAYLKLAKEYRGKLVCVAVNTDTEEAAQVAEFFGVVGSDIAVVGYESEVEKKFMLTDDATGDLLPFSADNLATFMKKFDAGELKPHIKSAAPPTGAAAYEKDVAVVVGRTVDTIVKDETKDVLLEVYAPWCGHCKQLAPIYAKLAKRLKSVDSIVIAKMDGTENEHPDVNVEGFPSILFFPARPFQEGDVPETFEGERTVDGFLEFLQEKSAKAFETPPPLAKKKKSASKEEL